MDTPILATSRYNRPFTVHFLYNDEPSQLLVLARSPCHAVRVMFHYFETFYNSIDMITYDSKSTECYVTPLFYFSDILYKHYKIQDYEKTKHF